MVYKTDLPPDVQVDVVGYRISVCHCQECGKSVRGQHPEVAPDQYGASAPRLGERLFSAGLMLHLIAGVTMRKVPYALEALYGLKLEALYGLKVSQSTLTRDLLRRSRPGESPASESPGSKSGVTAGQTPGYFYTAAEQCRTEIASAPRVHTDDTGWRIAGTPAYLMSFVNHDTVYYQIRPHHRNEEVREVIGNEFQGTLNTDGGPSYKAKELANTAQQKCQSHILRLLSEVQEKQAVRLRGKHESLIWQAPHHAGPDQSVGASSRMVDEEAIESAVATELARGCCAYAAARMRQAMHLRAEYREGKVEDYPRKAQAMESSLTQWLADAVPTDPDEIRVLKMLRRYHARGSLVRFLRDPAIEPTNNLAERSLRPAVIARKVSQCSKSQAGADAHAQGMSVVETLRKRIVEPLMGALAQVMKTGVMPPIPSTAGRPPQALPPSSPA